MAPGDRGRDTIILLSKGGCMNMGILFGSGLFEILFLIVFVIVLLTFILTFVRGISQWHKNNQSPRLTVEATVVSRRYDVSHYHHNDNNGAGHTTSSTWYYVTFQVASGDRMEFSVSGREYGLLAEGDWGNLSFQGTRYLGFQRK